MASDIEVGKRKCFKLDIEVSVRMERLAGGRVVFDIGLGVSFKRGKAKLGREISDRKNKISQILWSQNLVMELERDFMFSLTKFPS